jgi:hypothetical protein
MKHQLDINLDDETEAREFQLKYAGWDKEDMAKDLGLAGKGAIALVEGLVGYAMFKVAAMDNRLSGDIAKAIKFEGHCDTIYKARIQPFCECW